jgi:uncharacterized protein
VPASTVPLDPALDAQPKRRSGWRMFLIVIGVLASITVLYVGVASWVASSLVGNITEEVQKAIAKDTSAPPTDPLEPGYRGDPGQAFGYAFEDVMIQTPLGDAPAWFVPGQSSTWAIYVHGIGGHREGGYDHLSVLQPAGVPTLLITYRNDEDAPADPSGMYGFGLTEWHDLEAAVDYALAHGATGVILDGQSMGGAIIGQFMKNSNRADRVVALVLDCPALDMHVIAEGAMERARLPLPNAVASLGLWISDQRFDIPLGEARSIDVIAAWEGPLFLAHGDTDSIVPIATSDDLVTARYAPTVFLRTHAQHIGSWAENPERYREWLGAFLTAVLPAS